MKRLINSDSTITQVWNAITLENTKDGGDMFSETSLRTSTTRHTVPDDIYNPLLLVRKRNIPTERPPLVGEI
jgi:hypothetical protein